MGEGERERKRQTDRQTDRVRVNLTLFISTVLSAFPIITLPLQALLANICRTFEDVCTLYTGYVCLQDYLIVKI